jgi:hypothetical protein
MPGIESPLASWESFYVILGTSAAALTGLTFVVIVLLAEAGPRGSDSLGISTFITPTIVHFCMALYVAAILSAPWHGMGAAGVALGAGSFGGLAYTGIVLRRATRVRTYKFVLEDWVAHTALPVLAYGSVAVAAFLLRAQTELALFVVGGATLLLVFIGIHNAWDTVTFMTIDRFLKVRKEQELKGKKGVEGES